MLVEVDCNCNFYRRLSNGRTVSTDAYLSSIGGKITWKFGGKANNLIINCVNGGYTMMCRSHTFIILKPATRGHFLSTDVTRESPDISKVH